MQLKITGWIRFEKFRGVYAGDHCRRRLRSPRRSPPSSAQVEPRPSSVPEPTVTVADHQAVTVGPNDDDHSDHSPIERPYGEEFPRAVIQGNKVTVNVFGDNSVMVNVFDNTVTVTSRSD